MEKICRKSTWHDSFSRLAALRLIISKKQKNHFQIWSRRVCVPNFRRVFFSLCQNGAVQTDPHTSIFTSDNRNILDRLLASRGFWWIGTYLYFKGLVKIFLKFSKHFWIYGLVGVGSCSHRMNENTLGTQSIFVQYRRYQLKDFFQLSIELWSLLENQWLYTRETLMCVVWPRLDSKVRKKFI